MQPHLSSCADQPCMQHLKNRELREKLYKAYVTRASSLMAPVPQSSSESSEEVAGEKSHDNAPILERILVIRECMANMIGYPHYAAMSLASKMAGGGSSTASRYEMTFNKLNLSYIIL